MPDYTILDVLTSPEMLYFYKCMAGVAALCVALVLLATVEERL